MFGLLFWLGVAAFTVATICITVYCLDVSTAEDAMKNAAGQQGVSGWVQGMIDSVGDNHAVISLSKDSKKIANVDITYSSKSSSIYVGRGLSTYA